MTRRAYSFFPPIGRQAGWRAVAAALALLSVAACGVVKSPTQARGHKVDDDLLKELTPGTSTRADVTALLGSPSAKATFDDNTWLYVSSVTRTQVARLPGLDSQEVTVVRFTPQGVLQDIRRLNQDDAVDVAVVNRATPTPGSEMTFLQEFLGNVGRLNPSAPAGATGGGGGSRGGAPSQ